MAEALVPVAKSKTITVRRGDGSARETITRDVSNWSRNQLIIQLRKDTVDAVATQIRLENPPLAAVVDRTKGKPVLSAVRRTDVAFAIVLKSAALAAVVGELSRAIAQSTTARSGTLSNMANWEWVVVRSGVTQRLGVMGTSGILLGPHDSVALRPTQVPYASVVNMRVANGRRAMTLRQTRQRAERPAIANQGLGFLGYAARRSRRHSLLRAFNVKVVFTNRYPVAGEVNRRQGTGTLVITRKH
jgi:hypothetical protein